MLFGDIFRQIKYQKHSCNKAEFITSAKQIIEQIQSPEIDQLLDELYAESQVKPLKTSQEDKEDIVTTQRK